MSTPGQNNSTIRQITEHIEITETLALKPVAEANVIHEW